MATDAEINKTEAIIDYTFLSRRHLEVALRAPGAFVPGTPELPDGNRGLGQLGNAVLETVILDRWYALGNDRGLSSSPPDHQDNADEALRLGASSVEPGGSKRFPRKDSLG